MHLNTAPPKYTIAICIARINVIMKINGLFLLILDRNHRRELQAEKQLNMPEKINKA